MSFPLKKANMFTTVCDTQKIIKDYLGAKKFV